MAVKPATHDVALRAVRPRDAAWLIRLALRRELAGVQYSYLEWPLQPLAAPLRAALGPFVPACVVLVDGTRSGYVGRSPLSGNLEIFLSSEVRGGVGHRAWAEFLAHHRGGDRPRRIFVSSKNDRSWRSLQRAFATLRWVDAVDYQVTSSRHGRWVQLGPGPGAAPRPDRRRRAR